MPDRFWSSFGLAAAIGVLAGFSGGCNSSGKGEVCVTCNGDQAAAVWCVKPLGIRTGICADTPATAETFCKQDNGHPTPAPVCGSGVGDENGSDEPWNPDAYIGYDADVDAYFIDSEFVESLRQDFNQLDADSTSLVEGSDGVYFVKTPGELSRLLGWTPGDRLLEIDGHQLDGLDAVLDAYLTLKDSRDLILTLEREGELLEIHYLVE